MWRDIPIVVVSVDAKHEVGLCLGAAGVLQKPVRRSEFARELGSLGIVPSPARTVTVLVVDDDIKAVDLMSAYLSQPGYRILRAYGGKECIEIARQYVPDLIVLDLLMPDLSGIEVVEALKRHEATAAIPVMIVTGKEFSADERRQLEGHVLGIGKKSDFAKDAFLSDVRRAFANALRARQGARNPADPASN